MFWAYRQALILYATDPLVHKIVVELSRMVRVCLIELTPKKKALEGGAKTSRMTYSKDEPLIAISQNAGKKQVAARLRSYRDCTGESETQLTEQSLLNAIKAHRVDRSEAKHMDNLSDSFTKYMEVQSAAPNKRTTTVVNQQNRVFSSLNATKTPERRRTRPPSASCFENNKENSDRSQPHPSPHPHLPHARAGSWKRGRARSAVELWTETGSSRPPFEWGVAGRGG